jgi:hypothetical protein
MAALAPAVVPRGEPVDGRRVQDLVDECVGARGQLDQRVARAGVTGDDDGAVRGVDAVGERRAHRWVLDQRGGDAHLLVGVDDARPGDLPRVDEPGEAGAALVTHPGVDVVPVGRHEVHQDLLQRGRPDHRHRRDEPGPSEQEEGADIGVVVRMMVGDADRAQSREGHARPVQLPRDAVAAVDEVGGVIHQDHLGGRAPSATRDRAARGAEEDQLRTHRRATSLRARRAAGLVLSAPPSRP